jgi:hypothetical protein
MKKWHWSLCVLDCCYISFCLPLKEGQYNFPCRWDRNGKMELQKSQLPGILWLCGLLSRPTCCSLELHHHGWNSRQFKWFSPFAGQNSSMFLFFSFFLRQGLTVQPWLVSNSQFSCLSLLVLQ